MRQMYLYVGLAFFVVCVLFLSIPFRIILNYHLQQGEDLLWVEVSWLGLPLVRRFIPVLSDADSPSEEDEAGEAELTSIINALARCYHFVFDTAHVIMHGEHPMGSRHNPLYHWVLKYFSRDTVRFMRQIEELKWSTTIGLGDAAATAILAGALLGLKGAGFAWLQRKIQIDPARLNWQVLPHYGGLWIEVSIHCILRVNTGHIIITGIAKSFQSLFQKAAWWRKQLAAVEE
ncbi:MAG: DUF2953 domain-containing protein [Firmicutes bacterium]|nr:DUF2953 domain-containing protein [Bacillota bacterium]